jgi:molecular chaperone GrpE
MHDVPSNPNPNPDPMDLSDEVESAAQLGERVAKLEADLADANNRYLRLAADYQNSQRRAIQNEAQSRLDGKASVTQSILTVLDHFDLALAVDPVKASAAQVVEGVKVIRDELMKTLVGHGVGIIHPKPGEPFEPGRHEAVMHQPAEGIAPGLIAACFQPGYTIAQANSPERVVRPAKVAVTPA